MFKKNISRFIAIIFIVLISVGLTSGVGSSTDDLKDSVSVLKTERNVGDITLKSSSESGFSTAEVAALKKKYGEENVSAYTSYDVYLQFKGQKLLTRLYSLHLSPPETAQALSLKLSPVPSSAELP